MPNEQQSQFIKEVFGDLPMEEYKKRELNLKFGTVDEETKNPTAKDFKNTVTEFSIDENDEEIINKVPTIKPETLKQIEERRKKTAEQAKIKEEKEKEINKKVMEKYSAKS